MDPLPAERGDLLYSDNDKKRPLHRHRRRRSDGTPAPDLQTDSPIRSPGHSESGLASPHPRGCRSGSDYGSEFPSPELGVGKRAIREIPPRQARTLARKASHHRSRSVEMMSGSKTTHLSSSQIEKLESIFMKLLEDEGVDSNERVAVLARAHEEKASGKGRWGSMLGKLMGRSASSDSRGGSAGIDSIPLMGAWDSLSPPKNTVEPPDGQLPTPQRKMVGMPPVRQQEGAEAPRGYGGSLGRASGSSRRAQMDRMLANMEKGSWDAPGPSPSEEEHHPPLRLASSKEEGATRQGRQHPGQAVPYTAAAPAADVDCPLESQASIGHVLDLSSSDSESTSQWVQSPGLATPLSASAATAAAHMFPLVDQLGPTLVHGAPRPLAGQESLEAGNPFPGHGVPLPAVDLVESDKDKAPGGEHPLGTSGFGTETEQEGLKVGGEEPGPAGVQTGEEGGSANGAEWRAGPTAQGAMQGLRVGELSDSDFEWGNSSPKTSPVLSAISELELKALKAITNPEAGTGGAAGHSAQTLRQMADLHRRENMRDSEILLALAAAAEDEERVKNLAAEARAQAMGNQKQYSSLAEGDPRLDLPPGLSLAPRSAGGVVPTGCAAVGDASASPGDPLIGQPDTTSPDHSYPKSPLTSSIARAALEILRVANVRDRAPPPGGHKEWHKDRHPGHARSAMDSGTAPGRATESDAEPLLPKLTPVLSEEETPGRDVPERRAWSEAACRPAVTPKVPPSRPITAGLKPEVAVTILPPPPTKLSASRTKSGWWLEGSAAERTPFAPTGSACGADPHADSSSSSPPSARISWWETAVMSVSSLGSSAAQGLAQARKWMPGGGNERVAPGDFGGPSPRKPNPRDGFGSVPSQDYKVPGRGEPDDPRGWGGVLAHWICDSRVLILMAILGLLLAISSIFLLRGSSSSASHDVSVDASSALLAPPPMAAIPTPPSALPVAALPASGIPVCSGRCCSGSAPMASPDMPSMPSLWWTNQMADGARVQIRSLSNNHWWSPDPTAGTWSRLGAFQDALDISQYLTVTRVSATAIRLRTVEGHFLVAHADGSVRADQIVQDPATLFTVEPVANSSIQLQLRASDGKLLASHPDGSLTRTHNPALAETFDIREVMSVPSKRGVNLGNWFVVEEWMDPELFLTVPMFIDGLSIQLQSVYYGTWVTAGGGDGALTCTVKDPDEWETFRLRDLGDGVFQFRANDFMYVTARDGGGLGVFADQEEPSAEGYENFTLIFNPLDPTEFMMKAANGNFVTVNPNGTLTASTPADSLNLGPGRRAWNGPTVFGYNETAGVRGEWQLTHYLGRPEEVLENHRKSWIMEDDFAWLSEMNINAVRIPVGYWITEGEASEYPHAAQAVPYLDAAFDWAQKYGIDIYLSLNGAPGSQNGLEHSGSRDGIPSWATNRSNIDRTVAAIDWLAGRYAKKPAFFGISLLNEPSAEGVPLNVLKKYYVEAYLAVRKYSPCAYVGIQPRIGGDPYELDEFMARDVYTNTIIERHLFNLFDARFDGMTVQDSVDFVHENRTAEIEEIQEDGRLVAVGGWSLVLPEHMNPTEEDYLNMGNVQLGAYSSATAGWFFWTYKVDRPGWAPWDFRKSVAKGWLLQLENGGW